MIELNLQASVMRQKREMKKPPRFYDFIKTIYILPQSVL